MSRSSGTRSILSSPTSTMSGAGFDSLASLDVVRSGSNPSTPAILSSATYYSMSPIAFVTSVVPSNVLSGN